MGFVVKGLLRRYYINDKGKKITTYFLKENDFATDYPSFIKLNILLNV
jgi:CRP/FNR family transcriptional regulator